MLPNSYFPNKEYSFVMISISLVVRNWTINVKYLFISERWTREAKLEFEEESQF